MTTKRQSTPSQSAPSLPLDQVLHGDSLALLATLPEKSVNLVFADPPYNLQLQGELQRPNQTTVDAVTDAWDQFDSLAAYDQFTRDWLLACRRVLRDDGTLWVIGSYHNIFRVGALLMDCGFWILNDVIWHKTNPMPNFRGTRFTNATETLIWAQKSQNQKKYTFNYHAMKFLNEEKQMQNVWQIPLCTGAERIRVDGRKAHSTQKPEALLYRVMMSSSNPGDVVLDPFFGSGTTGAVARKLKRHFIGIEREAAYVQIARARIDAISPPSADEALLLTESKRSQPRVSFGALLESGYIAIGQRLYSADKRWQASVHADGRLICGERRGSIHAIAAALLDQENCNGWNFWYVEQQSGALVSIDTLRDQFRADQGAAVEG